jgi:alkylation response protein AidB-like acyl-CoA dehydrogenase
MVNRAAYDALQVFAGYGYTKEHPVERYFRDARLLEIGAGTTEIQKIIIAGEILKDY